MRKVRFLLLFSITWYILECKTEKYEECDWTYHGDTSHDVTRCFTDNSGYADFSCVKLSDITKNKSDADTLVWKQAGDKTDCEAPYNGCQCFEGKDEFSYDQYCKCIEGTAKVAETNEECQYLDSAETRCFTDNSGYADFSCVKLSDITKNNSDADTLVWHQERGKTDCKAPFTGCQCFENWDVFYYEQYCKCFVPDGPPKFPSTGVIHWKGTMESDTYFYEHEYTKEAVMGEVHKNSNGQYMKIEWTVGKKADAKFEILIPDTKGMFIKYVGSGKECSVYSGQTGKTLTSIWGKYDTDRAVERESYDGDTQVWTKFEYDSEWDQRWKWTIKFNEEKNYAIPIAYYEMEYIEADEQTYTTRFEYTYIPTGDNESFDLHTYCRDAEKWR